MNFIIATPVFNGMPALRRCIGSIRGQVALCSAKPDVSCGKWNVGCENSSTFNLQPSTPALQVLHIIQDGGSSDGTVDWLRQYDAGVRGQGTGNGGQRAEISSTEANNQYQITNNYRFTWSSERDAGMYDAINKAWASGLGPPVKGEQLSVNREASARNETDEPVPDNSSHITDNRDDTIVAWLNADEQYLPGTLETVSKVFYENPEVDFVYGNFIIVTPDGLPISARREIPLRMAYLRHSNLYAASCTLFFRRKIWDDGTLKFDVSYKIAGDMELVMRLLAEGYKALHINSYLALFGADSGNLSARSEDLSWQETARLWNIYQGFRNPLLRKGIKAARWLERLFSGCYRTDDLSFDYAEDEAPGYRRVEADKVTFRFGFDKIEKLKEKRCRH